MFNFKINCNFIILFLVLLFISGCNQFDIINPNINISNTISKSKLKNKKIIVNQIKEQKNSIVINRKNKIKLKEKNKITKEKLSLLDSIASNEINENDVIFEFSNERLLQGREALNQKAEIKTKKALTAVFKMLKRNSSIENHNLNLKNDKNIKYLIDYSLKSKKLLTNIVVKNILVFLPFTGPYSNFGNKIRQAIDLSILRFGSDKIKVIYFNTGSSYFLKEAEGLIDDIKPDLILGPFTRASVLKIKPYVKSNSIPMFAFTNDIALVEKNIWSLGFSPEEQIDSIMSCALEKGYKNYGLIVPNDLYGKIILDRSIDNLSFKPKTAYKQLLLSNSDMRNKPKLESILKNFLAYQEEKNQLYTSKFDAILIGGNKNFILEIAPLLAFYDIDSKKVQILGTEKFNVKEIKEEPSLEGAWFPMILNKKERNDTIRLYKRDGFISKVKEKITLDKKNKVNQKDFKMFWNNMWNDDEDYFARVGFDSGILAINFLNQNKAIEKYLENIEGLVTGFKFKENGYVKKADVIVEIKKLGKVNKIKKCFNNN